MMALILLLTQLSSGATPVATANDTHDSHEEMTMEVRYQTEINELHRFFQHWFNGELPDNDESFSRFSDVMATGFEIVSPNGRWTDRESLIAALRNSYGQWKNEGGPGKIWIEHYRLMHTEGPLALVTYEEWQEVGGERRGRLSTALFRLREGAPNGVEWLHVHETWLSD
ncbi:MAG: hypothetical protein WBH85_20280 [Thermoanaerobaculia bacterium]